MKIVVGKQSIVQFKELLGCAKPNEFGFSRVQSESV